MVVSDIKLFPPQTIEEFRFQEKILFPSFYGWPFNTRNRFKAHNVCQNRTVNPGGSATAPAYQDLHWEKLLAKNDPLVNKYSVFRSISLLLEHAFCTRFSLFTDCDSE